MIKNRNIQILLEGDTKTVTANSGKSTKYVTIYPNNDSGITVLDTASQQNFVANKLIYGDSVRETTSSNAGTSNTGWNTSSWNNKSSSFPGGGNPFFERGGSIWNNTHPGLSTFGRTTGPSIFNIGLRAVLVGVWHFEILNK